MKNQKSNNQRLNFRPRFVIITKTGGQLVKEFNINQYGLNHEKGFIPLSQIEEIEKVESYV